jgi:chemotaxis protein MotB
MLRTQGKKQLSVKPLGVALVTSAILLSGCVSKGKYDEVAEQNVRLMQQNVSLYERVELRNEEIALLQEQQAEIAEEMAVLITAGSVKMELMKDGLQLHLDNEVLFSTGSATLKPSGKAVLEQLVDELDSLPYQVLVIGNTDNVPVGAGLVSRYPNNWFLAGARAASVVTELEALGVPSGQLVPVSWGEVHPVASNDTAEGRAENRRIEVRLRPVVRK